ncbi:MAG: STAS domain-containing protein [bacterium]|nr:STAS domain-containing protein [bacterium]
MEITRNIQDAVTVIHFAGDLDIYAMPSMHDEFRACLDLNSNHIVVNMARVDALYSSGVGALIAYSQQLKKQDRGFALAAPSNTVRHVLKLMKLLAFFQIFDTEAQAIAGVLAKEPGPPSG